jgi:signal transduction histidine kinase
VADPPRPTEELTAWLHTQEEVALLVAHDLRNPLAAILANLSYLDHALKGADAETLETVADLKLSAEMLHRLVENYVAMSRLEATQTAALPRTSLALGSAARGVVERSQSLARSMSVAVEIQPTDDDPHVECDRGLLELLIENMVGNAVQHGRRGRRVLLTVATRGDRAVLAVEDGGAPYGPVERDFSRLGQLEIKRLPDARYSRGLALYVVGLIAAAYGAALETAAEAGRTTLRLVFPLAPA